MYVCTYEEVFNFFLYIITFVLIYLVNNEWILFVDLFLFYFLVFFFLIIIATVWTCNKFSSDCIPARALKKLKVIRKKDNNLISPVKKKVN